jgi:hypothetical protein
MRRFGSDRVNGRASTVLRRRADGRTKAADPPNLTVGMLPSRRAASVDEGDLVRLNPRRLATLGLATALCLVPAMVLAGSATVATPDAYKTDEDTDLVLAAPGVLENDLPDVSTCVVGSDTTGLVGSLALNADGSFTYSPPANFHGDTSFVYRIVNTGPCADQTADSSATVTITVAAVNDAPTAGADSFGVIKDHTLNVHAPGVLLNDHDIDGDSLTAIKVTNPAHGVVTLAADGSFSYTPGSGYVGPDAFSYRASDGIASSPTRVVTLTVTAVPPVPTPTPIPTPVPTAVPTPSPEITAEPSASAEPTASGEPTASEVPAPSPTAAPSPTPAPSSTPGPAAAAGGISLPVLLVIILLVLLIGFGSALYGPRWLARQRGEAVDDDGS